MSLIFKNKKMKRNTRSSCSPSLSKLMPNSTNSKAANHDKIRFSVWSIDENIGVNEMISSYSKQKQAK